jgi:hypothetical protein
MESVRISMEILPDFPRVPSVRGRTADFVFVVFAFYSRSSFVIGAIVGAFSDGFIGFLGGLILGAVIGFLMGRSLGLRGRDLTRGYYLRMYERGCGKQAGQLEALVELLRGNRLSMVQCRQIACAYAEAARQLHSCDSGQEREIIMANRNRKILGVVSGKQAALTIEKSEEQEERIGTR